VSVRFNSPQALQGCAGQKRKRGNMLVKKAKQLTGSLTRTSKMPGLSYSISAWRCKTGAKLRKIPGSVRWLLCAQGQLYKIPSDKSGPKFKNAKA